MNYNINVIFENILCFIMESDIWKKVSSIWNKVTSIWNKVHYKYIVKLIKNAHVLLRRLKLLSFEKCDKWLNKLIHFC